MKYFIILLFIMFSACQDTTQSANSSFTSASTDTSARDQASDAVQASTEKRETSGLKFYVFTNDFYNARGMERPYVRLISMSGESYIVPPVEYDEVKTEYAVINSFKVKSGCIKVPERSFPLKIHICDSVSCAQSRYLADIMVPNHYGIAGIGNLLIPQIYPVSPCSEEFVKLLKKI